MIECAVQGVAACAAEAIAARQAWQRDSARPSDKDAAAASREETAALFEAGALIRQGEADKAASVLDGIGQPTAACVRMRDVLQLETEARFDAALRLWFAHIHSWMSPRRLGQPVSGTPFLVIGLFLVAPFAAMALSSSFRGEALSSPLAASASILALAIGFATPLAMDRLPTRFSGELTLVVFFAVLLSVTWIAGILGVPARPLGLGWLCGWIAGVLERSGLWRRIPSPAHVGRRRRMRPRSNTRGRHRFLRPPPSALRAACSMCRIRSEGL